MNKKSIRLAIKSNCVCMRFICAVCHHQTVFRIPVPFSIFLADGHDVVCEDCVRKIEPQLLVMLDDWYKNHLKEYDWQRSQPESEVKRRKTQRKLKF